MNEIRNETGGPENRDRVPAQQPRLDARTAQLISMLEQNAAPYRRMGPEATMVPQDRPA